VNEAFSKMLAVGGKSNSLGRVDEVIHLVLHDPQRLDELYHCLFEEDAWRRMRAADALEKICRQQPKLLLPYVDRFPDELCTSSQPSVQWHVAQMYREIQLTTEQKRFAIDWLKHLLSNKNIDWIVAANAMETLIQFTKDGSFEAAEMISLLKIQQNHKSSAVTKRADKFLIELSAA
jgi:hypothetical protein